MTVVNLVFMVMILRMIQTGSGSCQQIRRKEKAVLLFESALTFRI